MQSSPSQPGNRLLASMPDAEWERVGPAFRRSALELGRLLYEVDGPITQTYFPTSGVISGLIVMAEGGTIEGLLAGSEGAFGVAAAFGVALSPWRVTVRSSGEALTIAPRDLAAVLPDTPQFERLLFRYSHAMQQMAGQGIACNRFHAIGERLARWLLLMADRTGNHNIEITHEFLARMLGTHRPSVSLAISTLEQAGLVRQAGRAHIEILNREGLEQASCECYRRIVTEIERVFD